MPKYIGPYKITQSYPNESKYILDLPPELKARRIHPSFHISRLHTFNANDDKLFPRREVRAYYDFGEAKDSKWLVDKIITHQWKGTKVSFLAKKWMETKKTTLVAVPPSCLLVTNSRLFVKSSLGSLKMQLRLLNSLMALSPTLSHPKQSEMH